MEKQSTISIRESGQQNTVKIDSRLKPEIASSVIQKWQSLIDFSAKIVGVSSGLIMKLNENSIEVLVKSNTEGNIYEAGKEATVIGTQKQLLVPDVTKNKIWKENNPDVNINMISYLDLPINWPDGEVFGTVCLLDKKENSYNQDCIDLLNQVKTHIETDLQLLVANMELAEQNMELKQTEKSEFRDISEQKKSAEEQTESLTLLNNLATQVPGVVYQYRLYPDGRSAFPYSSPGMWDIYEVTPEEVKEDASPVFTRIHPDDYDYIVKTITGSAKTQNIYESEFRVILPKQGLRWRYCNAKPELLEDGSTLWHGIITDVTERKLAEEVRLKSEEQYRILFETMTQGIVYQNADGEIISANPAAENILGLSVAQMTGMKSIDPRWKAVDQDKNTLPGEKHPAMVALRSGKEVTNFTQGIFNPKKNDYVWILVNSIPQFNAGEKKPYQVFSTFLDITEQKRAVEEQTRLLDIIEQSRNEIFVFYENTLNFKFVNQGAIENLGYSKKEMKSMTPLDIKPEFSEKQFRKILNPLKNGSKERLVFETLHQRKNRTTYPVEVYLQLQKSEDKNVFLAVINDITERKKNEEKIKQNEARLQSLVNVFQHQTEGVQEFLDYALDEAIKLTGSKIGYIYFYSEEKKEFTLNTWSNEVMDVCSVTEPQTVFQLEKTGIWGEAVRQRKEIVLNDFQAPNPLRKGLPEGHAPLFRYMTIPVFSDNKIVAVLGLANKKSFYEKYDVLQVQLLMDAVWKEVGKKRGEQSLAESEERFRAMVEGAPDPIFIQTDFLFSYLNKPALRLFGAKSEAELLGKPVMDRFHPNFHRTIKKRIKQLNEKQQAVTQLAELKFITLQGKEVWVETSGEPIFYQEKHGGLVFARDISERKKAQEALSHSHDLMQYIIEHDHNAIAVYDKNMNNIYVSQRFLNDYRVKDKNIIGKHHYDVFPDIPEKWKEVHRRALAGEVLSSEEDFFVRHDGSVDWTRWECRPWYEADGSIGGMIAYTEVINERKQKELEILKLNERLEVLIKSVQNLAAAQSLEQVQEMVAKSARKLIGADGATLVFRENGTCFYVNEDAIQPLWKGKKFPMHSCISGWVMQNKQAIAIEDIFTDKRIPKDIYSSTFIKSLAMVPVNISDPIGAIGNYWKEKYSPTETELQLLQTLADAAARAIENINLYAELEERVKQRTKQLQTLNKELETFTYSVSHDLKAPLRGIVGYSKLLLDEYGESLNEEAAHFINTIRSSTLQMNQLIDDLLSYSHLERSQMKQERIALKKYVQSIISFYQEELDNKGIKVELKIPSVIIVADLTGLSIALRNYIENAIKFSDAQKSPLIKIGCEKNPESWLIHVKDNGVGFDIKYHDRIFEIFQRLHRPEDFPGTGIGLAMVAKALQRMGGKAWAESTPGEGSTFFIEIPKNKSI